MTKEELAINNFKSGCNCSQAVFMAFADDLGIDETIAKSMTIGLGGGVGRMRETCGAVTAAAVVFGVVYGKNGTDKTVPYKKIQEFAKRFQAESGSVICAERLGIRRGNTDDPVPEKRTDEYYKKRPCPQICGDAARIIQAMLEEDKKNQ